MVDPAVLLQRIADNSRRAKELDAQIRADKSAIEALYADGTLEAEGWLDGNDACPCEGYTLARSIRRSYSYSPAVVEMETALKDAKRAEEAAGAEVKTSVSWTLRFDKEA